MMRNELSDLVAFSMIAEERSFTRAAQRLGVSQSALSHAMRSLEQRLGVELLARSSRSVSPTGAGDRMLKELGPAFEQIQRAVDDARKRTTQPSGRVRLVLPRVAFSMILMPRLATFAAEYPDIVLEVSTSNDPVDIVAGGFDAGIQIGEMIQRDMIAVRVGDDLRLAMFASPGYLEKHSLPRSPRDLKINRVSQTRITAPMKATMMEPMIPPPCQIPSIPKIHPPRMPPRMPRMMSTMTP
jgi:DNA-binding transcriptional LysR family regulator